MGRMIRMAMSDSAEIAVYHVEPEGERRGGLVVIQEIFGVTDHIRELCDEYAADGYEVLAPSLYDREHPGFEAEYTGPDLERAIEILAELKKAHPDLPVVIISGHGTIETAVAAIKKGAYDFVEKPFTADRLLLVVQRALETSKLKRENTALRAKSSGADDLIGSSAIISNVMPCPETNVSWSMRPSRTSS